MLPGDLNKIGKEGKTSWDSSLCNTDGTQRMASTNAVQEANRCYDNGIYPMLVQENLTDFISDVIDAILSTSDRGKAEATEEYPKIPVVHLGTRGATGKKTINAQTQFNALFDDADSVPLLKQTQKTYKKVSWRS